MNSYLRVVGLLLAASGGGFAFVGLVRSHHGEAGPWTSIGLSLVVVALVCLVLGISGKRNNT